MRSPTLAVVALAFVVLPQVASATTMTTKMCVLAPDALVSIGKCSVSNFANAGLRVTISADIYAHGDVHVDMANANGGNIEFECVLDGTDHVCVRLVDTGGPNAGIWTVTGILANTDTHYVAGANMTVDFLTL